jgi:hypothetical protein
MVWVIVRNGAIMQLDLPSRFSKGPSMKPPQNKGPFMLCAEKNLWCNNPTTSCHVTGHITLQFRPTAQSKLLENNILANEKKHV